MPRVISCADSTRTVCAREYRSVTSLVGSNHLFSRLICYGILDIVQAHISYFYGCTVTLVMEQDVHSQIRGGD